MTASAPQSEEGQTSRRSNRLTKEQRAEILQRLAAGESQASIARAFQVSHTAVYFIKLWSTQSGQMNRARTLKKRLLPEQLEQLKTTMKETVPADHGAIMAGDEKPEIWTLARARALSKKLFGKTASVRVLSECLPAPVVRVDEYGLTPPKPPGPPNVDLLPRELAADKSFVKYYLSPIARQIEQREYEAALAHYHDRLARMGKLKEQAPEPEPESEPDDDLSPPPSSLPVRAGFNAGPPAPGNRVGKHAKSKGNPFTKSKRRKKKR